MGWFSSWSSSASSDTRAGQLEDSASAHLSKALGHAGEAVAGALFSVVAGAVALGGWAVYSACIGSVIAAPSAALTAYALTGEVVGGAMVAGLTVCAGSAYYALGGALGTVKSAWDAITEVSLAAKCVGVDLVEYATSAAEEAIADSLPNANDLPDSGLVCSGEYSHLDTTAGAASAA